jgi:hypothetical protein
MQLLFLDDAAQKTISRERVGALQAVGGISIEAAAARDLQRALDDFCHKEVGFPEREPFKWSPNEGHWMRKNLIGEERTAFFKHVLELAGSAGAVGLVHINDTTKSMATKAAKDHEMDVLLRALERFNLSIRNGLGMVIVARPSGGRKDEDAFLAECAEVVSAGTSYATFSNLATSIVTMPFHNSRLLQIADLVASISTAMVAGHTTFAGPVFPAVKSILRKDMGRIGGVGLKIHPDFCYLNLYHWLLGDSYYKRGSGGYPLPAEKYPFASNPDEY